MNVEENAALLSGEVELKWAFNTRGNVENSVLEHIPIKEAIMRVL